MRRFVRVQAWHDVALAAAASLLVAIVEAGAAVSYLIVFALVAIVTLSDRIRHRREKDRMAGQP